GRKSRQKASQPLDIDGRTSIGQKETKLRSKKLHRVMSLYPDAASLNSPHLRRFPGMVRKRVGQDWLMRFMPFQKVYDRMRDRFQFGIPFVFKGGIAISRDFAAFAFYQDRITELILNCNYHGHHPLPGL